MTGRRRTPRVRLFPTPVIAVAAILLTVCGGTVTGQTVIAVVPVAARGGAEAGRAQIITEMIVSAMVDLPAVRVVTADSEDATDYRVEGTLWGRNGSTSLITILHDDRHNTIVDTAEVAIEPGRAETAILGWRDDLAVVLRRQTTGRTVTHAAYLLDEGNVALAWDYALQAGLTGERVSPAVERGIRGHLAAERLEPVFRRRLPTDAVARVSDALVLSPNGLVVDPVLDRIQEEREALTAARVREVVREITRAADRGEFDTARTRATGDNADALWRADPHRMAAVTETVAVHHAETLERAAASRLRRGDQTGAQRYLAAAAAVTPDRAALHRALQRAEDTARRRRAREIRRDATPDALAPRTVRDRVVWIGAGGIGSRDPEARYDTDRVIPTGAIRYAVYTPLLPYLRVARSAEVTVSTGSTTANAPLTRVDAVVGGGPVVGTEAVDLHLGAVAVGAFLNGAVTVTDPTAPTGGTTGDAGITGDGGGAGGGAEAAEEARAFTQGGLTAGVTVGAIVRVSARVRAGLTIDRRYTLWIPDLYQTPSTTVAVRMGVVF